MKNLAWLTIFNDLMMILDSGLLFLGHPVDVSAITVDISTVCAAPNQRQVDNVCMTSSLGSNALMKHVNFWNNYQSDALHPP